ncbi:MAG: hypothetical protein FWB83_01760 [Treponema sp.]|nr:hypothetical protein [Treponema sp.]
MANNVEISVDPDLCFSAEEQNEIISQINGIAEQNKHKLSEDAVSTAQRHGKKIVINAKKKGFLFPFAVNAAAAAVLCAGVFLLLSFNGRVDAQAKTGGAVYNLTEKALIEEIRNSTAQAVTAKEAEIAAIRLRLQEVDRQLSQVNSSSVNLSDEQISTRESLLAMQVSFNNELSVLQDERAQILEASRLRESRLRTQLEERTRELTAAQRTSGELESAQSELERLTSEQEVLAAIDAQISGGFSSISAFLHEGRSDQALRTIESLRIFCNNNALSSSRLFQAKREVYNQSFNLLETMINDIQNQGQPVTRQPDLQPRINELQETIAAMQRTIDSFSSGSSNQTSRITELEGTAASLRETVSSQRAAVSSLERASAEKDSAISALQTERSTLTATVTNLQTLNATQEQEITNLRNQITAIRQMLAE